MRELIIIANPRSGGGKGRKAAVQLAATVAAEFGVPVTTLLTERSSHATEIAAGLRLEEGTFVASVGGDGTAHEVVNGLMFGVLLGTHAALPPLLLVPCGSGNTLAFNVGIRTPADSLAALRSARPRLIDVIEITRPDDPAAPQVQQVAAGHVSPLQGETLQTVQRRVQYGVNMVGWALATAVMKKANDLRCLGGAQYNLAAYLQLIKNYVWVGALRFVNPSYPSPVPTDALETGRAQLASSLAGRHMSHTKWGAPVRAAAAADDGGSTGAGSSPATDAADGAGSPTAAGSADGAAAAAPAEGAGAAAPEPTSCTPLMSPLPPVTCEPCPYTLVQVQLTNYMGSKIPFCPFARLDDGLLDVACVKPAGRLELANVMELAKRGKHVLGKVKKARSGGSGAATGGGSGSGAGELAAAAPDAVAAGFVPEGGHAVSRETSSTALAGKDSKALRPASCMVYSQVAELIIEPADEAGIQGWKEAAGAAAKRVNVCDVPMTGLGTLNVDGELKAWTPARVKAVTRILPLLVPATSL